MVFWNKKKKEIVSDICLGLFGARGVGAGVHKSLVVRAPEEATRKIIKRNKIEKN